MMHKLWLKRGKTPQKLKRWGCLAAGSLLLAICGCMPQTSPPVEEPRDEPVANLRAVIQGTPPAEGLDELYRQLDELTIPELNCTLRFVYIPRKESENQLDAAAASGEYDFIPNGVFSNYHLQVAKNALLDLNEYLPLVPDLQAHYAAYSEDLLKSCEISGGLYGIPQYSPGVQNTDEGFFFREDLRKKWGLEPITDLETMEAYLYRAKETEEYREQHLITDYRIWTCLWFMVSQGKYLELDSILETPFLVALADDPGTLVNRMETPEFQTVADYLREWQEAGILGIGMLSPSSNENTQRWPMLISGEYPCETNSPFWSINPSVIREIWEAHPTWEFAFFPYCTNDVSWYLDSLADASVISISSKTRYPETAIRLLEKIHTDQRYYDLLRYGVEGIHYNLTDGLLDYSEIPSANAFGWTPITDEGLSRDREIDDRKWYEDLEVPYSQWQDKVAAQAKIDPLGGFRRDMSGLKDVADEIDNVWVQYYLPILCGYQADTDQAIQDANEALRQAGFGTYFASMQQQVAEHLGTGN